MRAFRAAAPCLPKAPTMKTWTRIALATLLAAATLAGCGKKEADNGSGAPTASVQAPGTDVIRIGEVGPLSGGDAHLGKDNENGAMLAADEINAAGGVKLAGKSYHVEILAEDDKGDPREATLAAQKLVDEGVVAVVGHLNSGCSIPASKIYHDAGVAEVSPSTTAIKYTEQGFDTAFRVLANDRRQGTALADYAVDTMHAKTAAVIDDRTAYGQGLADVVEQTLKQRGVTIVAREYTNDKATDFSAILTRIRAAHPDVIFYGGMDATAGPMARQMQELAIKAPLLAGDGACSPQFVTLAGSAAGVLTCSQAGEAVENLPKGAAFLAKYRAKFGTPVEIYAPYAYDAVYLIVDAIRRAGSLDRAAVRKAIATADYDGLTGHIAFDAKGDLRGGAITMFHVQDGKLAYLTTLR